MIPWGWVAGLGGFLALQAALLTLAYKWGQLRERNRSLEWAKKLDARVRDAVDQGRAHPVPVDPEWLRRQSPDPPAR